MYIFLSILYAIVGGFIFWRLINKNKKNKIVGAYSGLVFGMIIYYIISNWGYVFQWYIRRILRIFPCDHILPFYIGNGTIFILIQRSYSTWEIIC